MKRKHDPIGRALFLKGWPDPRTRLFTHRALLWRYFLAALLGAVIGGPAVLVVYLQNYC